MPAYVPTLEELRPLAQQGNLVPVVREVRADLETPVSAFLKVARGPSFLLESVEGGERIARYSFIGTEPYEVLRVRGQDPLPLVAERLRGLRPVSLPGLPPFLGGAVGYLSYEAARYFERLPSPEADPLGLPEAVFLFVDTLLVFDHLKHKIIILSHARLDGDPEGEYRAAVARIDRLAERLGQALPPAPPRRGAPGPVTANLSPEEYGQRVEIAKRHINGGDIIQVVPSLRLARPTPAPPFDIYRSLRAVNPSPYMFYLDLADFHIIGTSPELLVRLEDGVVTTHPIAGTRRRGRTAAEDRALEKELVTDEKERAEHVMLVDLGRNDIGRVSVPGTVRVPSLMEVERYSHVMHLVSHVQGLLRPELTCFDALRACFPAGTVSGAPKIRAMEIIAELEPHKRGPYAGAVGYFSFSGNMDTCITIRTIVLKDGVAYVQAGGGVVADSAPELEHAEALNKAQALLRAMDEAESA